MNRLAVVILILLSSSSAHAYIDPNAGGLLFQLLMPVFAALTGVWMFCRRWLASYLRRLWRWIARRKPQ